MAGESDMEQLNTIFTALGTPSEKDWPVSCLRPAPYPPSLKLTLQIRITQGFTTLSSSVQFEQKPRSDLSLLFSAASPSALSLLNSLLTYDPRRRLNSLQALQHPYFVNAPYPTKPERLPKPSKIEREQTVEEVGMPLDKEERKKRRRNGDGLDEVPGAKKVARRLDFS